jgi:hypothetical protein
MKARKVQQLTKAAFCGAVLMAACLLGSPAKAQASFQGKFTLPYEVHWGQATLPAGDYVITYIGPIPGFVIRDAHTVRWLRSSELRFERTVPAAIVRY